MKLIKRKFFGRWESDFNLFVLHYLVTPCQWLFSLAWSKPQLKKGKNLRTVVNKTGQIFSKIIISYPMIRTRTWWEVFWFFNNTYQSCFFFLNSDVEVSSNIVVFSTIVFSFTTFQCHLCFLFHESRQYMVKENLPVKSLNNGMGWFSTHAKLFKKLTFLTISSLLIFRKSCVHTKWIIPMSSQWMFQFQQDPLKILNKSILTSINKPYFWFDLVPYNSCHFITI